MRADIWQDVLALGGGGLMVYGASLVWVPAAWMLAGIGCLTIAVLWRRAEIAASRKDAP